MSNVTDICKLCLKSDSKYTCPRCHIKYCSSDCYKGNAHMDCSELFYKDCFMQGLKECEASSDDRQKMIDMLQRLENDVPDFENEVEDDSDDDLEERLAGLDLDNVKDTDMIWEKLSEKERKEFKEMLDDGRLANLVELWEPWWKTKNCSLVEEMDLGPRKYDCPDVFTNIPDINTLTKNPVSHNMKFNVVNLILSYAFTARLYNGDYMDMINDSCSTLRGISEVFNGKNYDCSKDAIHSCMESVIKSVQKGSLDSSREFAIAVVQDVVNIIEGPDKQQINLYSMSALSEIFRMFKSARKSLENEIKACEKIPKLGKQVVTLKETKKDYHLCQKKIEFYLSWMKVYGSSLSAILPEIEAELCFLMSEIANHNVVKSSVESKLPKIREKQTSKKLIEEISSAN